MERDIWVAAPLDKAIGHILQRYHETHRRQLAEIMPLAQKVAKVHEGVFPQDLMPVLTELSAELESHMMKEERVLFPMALQGMGQGAAMPVRMMMHEHDDHADTLARLRGLTDDFTAPPHACGSWQRLYAALQELAEDLAEHIELENEVVFPKILNH